MKKSGFFAASVAAASASVISVPSSTSVVCDSRILNTREEAGSSNSQKSLSRGSVDQFAPRFDGLRFIETLVTAHR